MPKEHDLTTLETRLGGHIEYLAGTIGERNVFHPSALDATAYYIETEWTAIGYNVTRQTYEAEGVLCANLEITHWGTDSPADIILLGAHYDSVLGSPGANDNASGVAALLEISRLIHTQNVSRTIRFVAFVNEEPPFFFWGRMGSQVYAKVARKRGDNIRQMMCLETIGYYAEHPRTQRYPPLLRFFYPDRADFLAFVGNLRSRRVLHQTVAAFRAHSNMPVQYIATISLIPGVSWSDHRSFWRQGYPALMVTDTAFYRYRYYHTAQDTPDKLNYHGLAGVTSGLADAVVDLALQTE
jgi:Zn-dependent M28 family amino/carboxypeptidase